MAEKTEDEKAPSIEQNLTCPLCLYIFDEPTLLTSCKHTFCRKCLKKYDLSHQDLDHMVCPLCRKITKLSSNRVDDLTNVTFSELLDNYHGKCGGVNAVLEMRPACIACKFYQDAVSFCRTCQNYLCDECLHSHQRLTIYFAGHEIVSIEDIIAGKVSIGHPPEKCSVHKQENKDLYCVDCRVHVCHKCVTDNHQNHKIKNQDDFDQELRLEVNELMQRCATKKSELEKNIQNVETQRRKVHTVMQKLRQDVSQAYSLKVKQLEENRKALIDQIDALERSFDDDLDVLKTNNRQKIESIFSSMTLVANDGLGRLETDSLSAHILLCEELKDMLKDATDHTSATAITEKAQKKWFEPADDTRLDLGNISHKELQVTQSVKLRDFVHGMTKYSDDSVAVGYLNGRCIRIIDSAGNRKFIKNLIRDIYRCDLVFQHDRSFCLSEGSEGAYMYTPDGSKKSTIDLPRLLNHYFTVNASPSDEIIIANNNGKKFYIYDPTGTKLKHTVPTKHQSRALQASATKAGLIITSSCDNEPSIVAVYDRNGNAGKPLQAPSGIYLYAAVDEQDRVYVASADCKNSKVVIRLYDLDGLNLKERVEFNELNLTLERSWCYLVSLSPALLAFACRTVYFIKVSLY